MSKKQYQPIGCHFYDLIEEVATFRKEVIIEFKNDEEEICTIKSIILDTQTTKQGEFILLQKNQLKIRMDELISINGQLLSESNSCSLPINVTPVTPVEKERKS